MQQTNCSPWGSVNLNSPCSFLNFSCILEYKKKWKGPKKIEEAKTIKRSNRLWKLVIFCHFFYIFFSEIRKQYLFKVFLEVNGTSRKLPFIAFCCIFHLYSQGRVEKFKDNNFSLCVQSFGKSSWGGGKKWKKKKNERNLAS